MQAMSERTIKSKIEAVYDVVQGEKMSDAKCMHLMNYIVPVARYFDHLCSGVPKKEAGELVAQGCFFHAKTIRQLSNDFIATEVSRRKTVITKDAAGTTTKRITTTKVTKRRFKFPPFEMGCRRSQQSIMQDEKLRARATVWLRLNSRKKKGKPNMKASDFQEYLQNTLLKDTGNCCA